MADQIAITARIPVDGDGREVVFYSRPPWKSEQPRLTGADIRSAAFHLFYLAVALAIPQSRWEGVCRVLSGRNFQERLIKDFPGFATNLAAVTGARDREKMRVPFREFLSANHRALMLLCADLTKNRWRPRIELKGGDGLARALDRGRGAIVWCNPFTTQTTFGKRALHEAGFRCHQVSVPEHGSSGSAFSMRFLRPLLVRVENRCLAGRIVFDREDTFRMTKAIIAVLRDNGVVLMTNNYYAGSTFAEVPLGVFGYHQFATTPVNLAARHGAALFAMSTFETEPLARYEAVLSPEIAVSPVGAAGNPTARNPQAIAGALLQVADLLFADLRRHPEQYLLWHGQAQSVTEGLAAAATVSESMDGDTPRPDP